MSEKPTIEQLEQLMQDGYDLEIKPTGEVHIRDVAKEEKAQVFLSGLADLKKQGEYY